MSKIVVSESDVLCGRDRLSHGHPGNRTFRKLVDERAATYKRSTNRHQKTKIIQSIIQVIQEEAGGRFLTLEDSFLSGNIVWKEMDPQSAHQKVAHALRSKQSSSVKGSLRGGALFDSCRSVGNASTLSRGTSARAHEEAHAPQPPATAAAASATKRQSGLHFLDALIDQQDSLLQSLHISVEFGAKDTDVDNGDNSDDQSQCSDASELTSSSSESSTEHHFPLDDDDADHLVSAEAERLLIKNISEERSTASTYFFTLEGTLAEF
jgi:hypothetical protein